MKKNMFSSLHYSLGKYLYNLDVKSRRKATKAVLKQTDGDIKIKYLEMGDRRNETVIIFHGFSDSKDSFLRIAKRLMQDYHLVIPDMPGFGENEQVKDYDYTISQYTSWMTEFIDKVELQKFHLIGHSMGGAVASNIAIEFPENLQSLTVLCGGGVITSPLVGFYKMLAEGKNLFSIKTKQDFNTFLNTNFHKMPFMPKSVKHFVYKRYYDNCNWYNKVMQDLIGFTTHDNLEAAQENALNEKLENISTPTLIVWGEYDKLFPAEIIGKEYHQRIKNSKFNIIPNAGHCLNLEVPGAFSHIYRNFLTDIKTNSL